MLEPMPAPAQAAAVARAAQAHAPLSFKVLTLNTHKGFSTFNRKFVLHDLREAVRGIGADVVFLQEVLGNHERHPGRYKNWPAVSQYEFLADQLWTDFAYGRNAVYPEGHHGNAVLSKFPIVRHANHDVSLGTHESRGLLHCTLRMPGRTVEIHAICVHLALLESHRREQLARLCALVHDAVPADAPLIVAGDFNDWRLRAHDQLRGCGLREAFVEGAGRAARTFPAMWPLLKLDRIYFRNARVVRPAVLSALPWSHLSDHAALAVEIHCDG
jgi:endonuclease/exonuclease/phosphatase family metal-dependent hydrolase